MHLVFHSAPAEYLSFLRNVRIPYCVEGHVWTPLPARLSLNANREP